MDLISIALCTFNGERFISEQIDSILKQSYSNIELVICDDGSTDRTIEIIQTYQQSDTRITFYQNNGNLGFVKNFEKAISLCSGAYIALADQDDIWKPYKLEKLVQNIGDNLLIYTDAMLIDENSNSLGKNLIRPKKNLIKGENCNRAFLLTNCVSGNTMMFSKKLIDNILPIPETISFHDIWIAFVASTEGSITYVEEPLTYYRRYAGQITAEPLKKRYSPFENCYQKKIKYLKNMEAMVGDLKTFLGYKGLSNETTKYIIVSLIEHFSQQDKHIFNFKIYNTLIKYKKDVFAIIPSKRKRAFKVACGLKVHIYTCFLI